MNGFLAFFIAIEMFCVQTCFSYAFLCIKKNFGLEGNECGLGAFFICLYNEKEYKNGGKIGGKNIFFITGCCLLGVW